MSEENGGRVGWRFVAALLAYGLGAGALYHLFSPHPEPQTVLDHHLAELSRGAAAATMLGVAALAVVLTLAGAGLLQGFWNRFLSDVFGWRTISLPEALALSLTWWLLFAGTS